MRKIKIALTLVIGVGLFCSTLSAKGKSNLSVMDKLIKGNQKYQSFNPTHPDQSKRRLAEVYKGQHPMAVVVSCSDSRVSPELIFDQGVGDLFVIRTAGHAVSEYELASIEYAVEHLHCKEIIVLGHEKCGAIQTFIEHSNDSLPKHLNHLIDYLRHEEEEKDPLKHHNVKEAILANILHTSKLIKNNFEPDEVNVHSMYYNLVTGKVEEIH